jgi:hypothetical protein
MNTRLDELLPFYVNGTLDESERAWVDATLNEHPKARAQLDWYRSLQDRLREDVPPVSSEIGMERALRRIRTEGPMPQSARRVTNARSLLGRLADWFGSLVPQPMLRPAFAGALGVIALQAVLIAGLMAQRDEDDTSELRAIQGSVAEQGPYLKLNFKGDAREADIRMLLVEVQGTLAAGPGQLGDYYVRVPESRLRAVTDKIRASPIVDGVAVVDALPARP